MGDGPAEVRGEGGHCNGLGWQLRLRPGQRVTSTEASWPEGTGGMATEARKPREGEAPTVELTGDEQTGEQKLTCK